MQKSYFYIAVAPNSGPGHIIKIGITDNYESRLKGIRSSVDHLLNFKAVYKCDDRALPRKVEMKMVKELRRKDIFFRPREKFIGYPDKFIEIAEYLMGHFGGSWERVI